MSGDGNAPGVQDLQRRLQENQEGQEEGEIREETPTQEPPPAGQIPHPNTQGGTPSELGSPQSMAVDPVSVVDPSRLCLHSRDGRRLRNHTPRQVGCPNNREPGGVDEYDVPMDYANSSAAFPDNGKWSARGYEASIHEMTLGWNATTAQRLKQNPAGFIVIRPFFSTGLRLRDADDAIPAAVREHLAVMYPPLAEANVMWAGSLADAKNCEGRLAHGHRQGPNFIIIPERENLPQNFVNLLFEHRIWAFTENLAFIAIKPEQADASWYIASFACNVPSDSIITRSKVLSLVRCAVEGHRTLANFAREFTAALPQRPEKERVREVLDTWDVRHIMVGTQHVWQLTGMPPRKEGQPDPHLRAKKEIQDMLSKVKWDDYALDFGMKLSFLDPMHAPTECDACGDIYHATEHCSFITAPDWRGPRSVGAARTLAGDVHGIVENTHDSGLRGGRGGRGGYGGRGGRGGYRGRGGRGGGRGRGF
ncbi:hypothetical protein FB107DRAFT_279787 [Schizophyllum commune]